MHFIISFKKLLSNKLGAERSRSDKLVALDTNFRSLSGVETNGICLALPRHKLCFGVLSALPLYSLTVCGIFAPPGSALSEMFAE